MSGLVTNLIALAEGLQARLVTRAEAAERLQVLADRVPTFVVWAKEMNGQEPVLCYLSTAGRQQDALAEAKRALGPGATESIRVEVAPGPAGDDLETGRGGKGVDLWVHWPRPPTGSTSPSSPPVSSSPASG